MSFYTPIISALAVAALGIFLIILGNVRHYTPSPNNTAPASMATIKATTTPVSKPILATTLPDKPSIPQVSVPPMILHPLLPSPEPTSLPIPAPTSYLQPDVVNTQMRKSLVNILCTTKGGGYFRPISGSGVIISRDGIILTNAHVAEFFLLRDYLVPDNVDCVIRTGSPAEAMYRAKILYLPPAWVSANASQIKNGESMGTGEDDYAFLLITSNADGTPLPAVPASEFPAALLTTDVPKVGDPVVLDSYPAQFLGGDSIQMNLYASAAVSTIQNVYTFSDPVGPVDVVSLGSSIVSQSGSSGGAAARLTDGALFGIISTATEGTTTSSRILSAITLAHIDRSLAKYGKGGLVSFLTVGNSIDKMNDFTTNVAPGLTKLLTDALK